MIEAVAFYDSHRRGLGREFLSMIKKGTDAIAHSPMVYPVQFTVHLTIGNIGYLNRGKAVTNGTEKDKVHKILKPLGDIFFDEK